MVPSLYKLVPIVLFLFFTPSEATAMHHWNDVQFSLIEDAKMEGFEKKLAYYFGVKFPELVIEAYVNALKRLESIGSGASINVLEEELIPCLEKAYQEIAKQTGLRFDPHQAAKLELQIILGNAQGASFEAVQNHMCQLYAHVFQSTSPNIRKAAMLRTFIYQYKVDVLKREKGITDAEMNMLISLSETSKELLNSLE